MGILGPPSYGIGATIRIGREMLCFPYAGFFIPRIDLLQSRDAATCIHPADKSSFKKKIAKYPVMKVHNKVQKGLRPPVGLAGLARHSF